MTVSGGALLALAAWMTVLALGWMVVRRRRGRGGDVRVKPLPTQPRESGLRETLRATRERLLGQLERVLRDRGGLEVGVWGDLVEVLVGADVGVQTASMLVRKARERVAGSREGPVVLQALRAEVEAMLGASPASEATARPWVILLVGVNGVGKTTTLGKLAALHRKRGRRVLLVAGDTFRAAAIDQLAVWAERTGSDLVRQGPGADPAAVAHDGMAAARARDVDVVLIDTAGRLHTRGNLMEELRKIHRVVARAVPGAPHETLLVVDATTGQNAIAQARTFAGAVEVTGIILTKLDGTAKGGVVVSMCHDVGVPVRYVGVGEGMDDLRPFEAREFAEALFAAGGGRLAASESP
jgi:fused signal recognition particle receptor